MKNKDIEKIPKAPFFSNGSDFMGFQESCCFDCLNFRSVEHKIPFCQTKSENESGFGCTITDMFFLYQEQLTVEQRNTLLPDYNCPMRLTVEQARIKANPILQKQNLELKQKVLNLKKGFNQKSLFEEN